MADLCVKASVRAAHLEVCVGVTTETCQAAQAAHGLALTSIIALGRLLTAATLMAQTSKRAGTTSLQVLSRARIRQVFADVSHQGDHRGFAMNKSLAFPALEGEAAQGRRSIALATLPGTLSVVRQMESGGYRQSSVELVSGELDHDVEHFLEQSDQVPTALACEVLVDPDGRARLAAGVLVQGLPGADRERLHGLRERVHGAAMVSAMEQSKGDVHQLLAALIPDAVEVEAPLGLRWRCRCSKQRVLGSLQLLEPGELDELVERGESLSVACDLCAAQYQVGAEDLALVREAIRAGEDAGWLPAKPKAQS